MGLKDHLGIIRQVYATLIINLGVFSLGTVFGWTSPGLEPLKNDFNLTNLDESWISSINHLGGLTACLVAGSLMDKFGRKNTALLFTIPSLLGWGLLIGAQNVPMLYASRFILGFSTTYALIGGPVLVSEISEAKIRGALSIVCGVFITAGMLFTYIVGTFVEWQMLSIICSVVPVISFLLIFTIKESPRHMLQQGNDIDGITAFYWYRGLVPDINQQPGVRAYSHVQSELEEIKADIDKFHRRQKKNSKISLRSVITSPEALKPLSICVILMLIEQLSGYAAIVAFTAEIIAAAGIHESNNLMAIIFGLFQFMATIIACVLIDRFGRKPLLIFGQICMFVSLLGLGLCLIERRNDDVDGIFARRMQNSAVYRWLPLLCLIVYIVNFCIGIVSVAVTLMGELLPQNVRGIGSAICTAGLRITAFVINFEFKYIGNAFGPQSSFFFFAAVCAGGLVFIVLWVPETKGKTLEEINALFSPRRVAKVSSLEQTEITLQESYK